jgi:hypothetical protein
MNREYAVDFVAAVVGSKSESIDFLFDKELTGIQVLREQRELLRVTEEQCNAAIRMWGNEEQTDPVDEANSFPHLNDVKEAIEILKGITSKLQIINMKIAMEVKYLKSHKCCLICGHDSDSCTCEPF